MAFVLLLAIKGVIVRKIILLSASYYFYAYWDYRFLGLIVIVTLLNFYISLWIANTGNLLKRRSLFITILIINLCLLGLFKYYNFFIHSLESLPLLSHTDLTTLNLILPLGISFYIFRVISYAADVYTKKMAPCVHIIDFAIYVAFFPIIISGPISRASSFLPQLKKYSISISTFYAGSQLFIIGLFLKVFIADRLAMFVNYFYAHYKVFDTLTTWLATVAYSLQIYADFAGYSSMAIGMSLILGFEIEENFHFPYLARNIREFWRRWHITLSTWIRDYVYIPLGGNRKGKYRTYVNLIIAMTICGLWHGAAWTFVLWGLMHGIALVINHIYRDHFHTQSNTTPATSIAYWAGTFLFVTLAWVVFRSGSISEAMSIYSQLFCLKEGITWLQPFILLILVAIAFVHVLSYVKVTAISLPLNSWYTMTILFCLIWLAAIFHPSEFQPFVYENF